MAENGGKIVSSSGLKENLASLLCYVLGFITGFLFFLTEKKSKLVRFHALQSIFFSLGWFLLQMILTGLLFFAPTVLKYLLSIINLLMVILWVFLMVKAYQGEYYLLPVAGKIALDNAEIKE